MFANESYDKNYYIDYVPKVDIESFNGLFSNYTKSAKLENNYKSIVKSDNSIINNFVALKIILILWKKLITL